MEQNIKRLTYLSADLMMNFEVALNDFNVYVDGYVKNGWQPLGPPLLLGQMSFIVMQPMVKYE